MKTILEEAQEIIYGDRERTYGNPAKNLRAIADFWNGYMLGRFGAVVSLSAVDVCAMMRLLKEARLMNNPTHRDSLVDVCGYAALQDRVNEHDPGRTRQTEVAGLAKD